MTNDVTMQQINAKLIGMMSSALPWLYNVWYLEWIIQMNILRILNFVGMFAYASKLYLNMSAIPNLLAKNQYTDLEGNTIEKRHVIKALFKIYDTVASSLAYIGYFLLRASWTSPLFIAIGFGFFAKSGYSFIKNTYKLYNHHQQTNQQLLKIDKDIAALSQQEELKQQLVQLKLEKNKIITAKKRHQAKLKRSAFDVIGMTSFLFFTVMFCVFPAAGALGLLATGVAYVVGRKKLNKTAKQTKFDAIKASKALKAHQISLPNEEKPKNEVRQRKVSAPIDIPPQAQPSVVEVLRQSPIMNYSPTGTGATERNPEQDERVGLSTRLAY